MYTYTLAINSSTGVVTGVNRSDGAFVPYATSNADWQVFLSWNAAQTPPLSLANQSPTALVPLPVFTIGVAIAGLTTSQWSNIVTAFFAGSIPSSPPAWILHQGLNAAALGAIYVLAVTGAYTVTSLTKPQQIGVMAMICQDAPLTLVNPSFDPTINVAGGQVV